MKNENGAHFDQVRAQNRKAVRNMLRYVGQIGKTEISNMSGLSFPTVSALLNELVASNEVIELTTGASRGGRPGAEYALNPFFHMALCAYIKDGILFIRMYDVFGKLQEEVQFLYQSKMTASDLLEYFQQLQFSYPTLSVICLGIPGVVLKGEIIYLPCFGELEGVNLRAFLEVNMNIPVFLENDINIITAAQREQWPDLAHILLSQGCIGAGIMLDGKIIQGVGGYAGELEYLYSPKGSQKENMGELLKIIEEVSIEEDKKQQHILFLVKIIGAIVCVINPNDIALSGFGFNEEDLIKLQQVLEKELPRERIPQLHLVEATDALYHIGLLEMAMGYWKTI